MKVQGVYLPGAKGPFTAPSWFADGCWVAFAPLSWHGLGFWAAEDVEAQRSRVCMALVRLPVQPVAGRWFLLLLSTCPEQAGAALDTREERGWCQIFFFFFSCQTKRKKETVPSVSQKGRSCSGLQEEAGDLPVLRAGTTWGLTREMFSCLEHNCQWKSLSTDFSAQKHCGLGHFGEDF